MLRFFKWIVISLIAIITLAIAAVGAIIVFVDPNDYKPQIEQQAGNAGIKLALDGDIGWHFYPFVGINIQQAKLYPHDGEVALVELGELAFSLAVLPLLSGEIIVKGVAIQDTSIQMEESLDGSANWERLIKSDDKPDIPESKQQKTAPKQPATQSARQKKIGDKKDTADSKASKDSFAIKDLSLGFIEIDNVKINYLNQSSGLSAKMSIVDISAQDIKPGNWIPVNLEVEVGINEPEAEVSSKGSFEVMFSQDISKISLRNLDINFKGKTALLSEEQQNLDLLVEELHYNLTGSSIQVKKLGVNIGVVVDALAKERQKIKLESDIDFALRQQLLNVANLSLELDAALSQPGNARQLLTAKGEAEFSLANMALSVPQLDVGGRLTYPQMLTEPAVLEAGFNGLQANIADTKISLKKANINLANKVGLSMTNTSFAKGVLQSSLNIPEFNIKNAMSLVKIDGKPLTDLLPKTSNPKVLQKLSFSSDLKVSLEELAIELNKLLLALDSTKIKGNAAVTGLNKFIARLDVDAINVDDYLPATQKADGNQKKQDSKSNQSSSGNQKQKSSTGNSKKSAEDLYSKDPVLPLEIFRTYALDLNVAVGKLGIKKNNFSNIKLQAKNNRSKANAQLTAKGFEGSIKLDSNMAGIKATPNIQARVNLTSINLKKAQSLALEEAIVDGKGNVAANLKIKGNSIYSWVHSLSGPLNVNLDKGKLLGLNLSKEICSAASSLQGNKVNLDNQPGHTNITKMVLAIVFNKGKGDIKSLNLAVPDLGTTATGKIDLPRLSFNIPLKISITGNKLAKSCSLPKEAKLALICSGQLFKDSPLSFCKPDLSSLKDSFDALLDKEKEKVQQQLREKEEQAKAELAKKKKEAQKKLDAEKKKAREKLDKQKQKAKEKLDKKKKKAEEDAKKKLEDKLKKLF